MPNDVLEQYRQRLPKLFAEAVLGLQAQAKRGDAKAAALVAQLAGEPISTLLRLEGEGGGEFYANVGAGILSLATEAAGSAFGHALSVSVRAARHGLRLLDRGEVDALLIASALAGFGSAAAREQFGRMPFAFELEILDVPGLGSLRAKVSLGRPQLAATPEFKLSVDYDELEDAREQGLRPHQLFLAGKIRIDGDASKAMQLGMILALLR